MVSDAILKISFVHKLDRHLREVIQGAAVTLMLKVLGTGLEFGFTLFVARLLGAEDAGIYYLALTITTIGTVCGRLGLDNVVLRLIAANAAAENWRVVAGVYRAGVQLAFFAS
jgi:O-antigen/teichoic acid export membrane protein